MWYEPEKVVYVQAKRPYSCMGFLGDVIMTLLTSGLWLIWVFVREMRNQRY